VGLSVGKLVGLSVGKLVGLSVGLLEECWQDLLKRK
jgi:hypothetical protein